MGLNGAFCPRSCFNLFVFSRSAGASYGLLLPVNNLQPYPVRHAVSRGNLVALACLFLIGVSADLNAAARHADMAVHAATCGLDQG